MRLGVDVGGTNTDAVLMDGTEVVAWAKRPTSSSVSRGVAATINAVLEKAGIEGREVSCVMIGTTQFANALVQRRGLQEVGVIRLASPSGEALPPMTGWPADICRCIGETVFLLPGGYEFDGREISAFDEKRVRDAARALKRRGVRAAAITSVFGPVNPAMEKRAAAIIRNEDDGIAITTSSAIGRIGFLERENTAILNAALSQLAGEVIASFQAALRNLGMTVPLYVSQNDGTLISAAQATRYPVMTIGSGPTNSMRGAVLLTGLSDAIVMDVGGTTTDIGALANGFPRESSIAEDIGGVGTNFRMPDIHSIGLGGGTRIHLDRAALNSDPLDDEAFEVGPDSVGFDITTEALVFGGSTLTASDIAIAAGCTGFGNPELLPPITAGVIRAVMTRFRHMLEDGIDRIKTTPGSAPIIAVGGGNFLIPESLKGAASVIRPEHAAVANAIGAAIAQVGAQVEQIVTYETTPRAEALEALRKEACARVVAAGGEASSVRVADIEEVFLSYLPGRAAQIRVKAIGDLAIGGERGNVAAYDDMTKAHHVA